MEFSDQIEAIKIRAQELRLKHGTRWHGGRRFPSPMKLSSFFKPMEFKNFGTGRFTIEAVETRQTDVITRRNAVLLDLPHLTIDFPAGTQFHKLMDYQTGRCLTSDLPLEIYQQYLSFSSLRGDVLVGGLGLGMAPELLLRQKGVRSVTVVERELGVIELIAPQIDSRINIVHDDLFSYLKTLKPGTFNSAFYDIWFVPGEQVWNDHVIPLYRMSRKADIHKLGAWGEYEMRAQLIPALYMAARSDARFSADIPLYRRFLTGLQKSLGTQAPYESKAERHIMKYLRLFLHDIGTPRWEQAFGSEL